jgi:hypothetical protein
MAHCLWSSDGDRHSYHLANSRLVAMEKDFGGLRVPSLRELNLCLLGYWLRRYSLDDGKIWKQLIDYKYKTENPNILCCKDVGASNF